MAKAIEIKKVNNDGEIETLGFAIQPNPDQMYIFCKHPVSILPSLKNLIPGFSIDQFPLFHNNGSFFEDGNWLGDPAISVTFISLVSHNAISALALLQVLDLNGDQVMRIIEWCKHIATQRLIDLRYKAFAGLLVAK